MSLKTEFDKLKFDVRMQDINLGSKMTNPEEIKSHLNSLQDCSDNATQITIDEVEEVEVSTEAEQTDAVATTEESNMGNMTPNFFGSDGN